MNNAMPLQIKVGLRIAKPAADVFEAIADPAHMTHYFISKSSGRMEEGKTVQWTFPEMDIAFPVLVKGAAPHRAISFAWGGADGETLVEIQLNALSENITFVAIAEGEKEANEEGIR